MIEQLVFVACLTLQVISDDGQLFAERTDEEFVIMMFNHAINACTGCYIYNVLFLRTRE